ncbi:gamma-tubulin complex component [Trichonephila clavipes]|nr:gamma-tubulin complex component [Trichonephila clavipes]
MSRNEKSFMVKIHSAALTLPKKKKKRANIYFTSFTTVTPLAPRVHHSLEEILEVCSSFCSLVNRITINMNPKDLNMFENIRMSFQRQTSLLFRILSGVRSHQGLGSNPGEDMDACKCIVPFRHGGTLNSRQTANLASLVEGEEGRKDPGHPQGFLPLNWAVAEQNRTVTCMVLKAKVNDRCKNSSP